MLDRTSLAYFAFLNGSFIYALILSCFGHLENISVLNYIDIQSDDSFHYKIPKIHIVNITNSLIKKQKQKHLTVTKLSRSR